MRLAFQLLCVCVASSSSSSSTAPASTHLPLTLVLPKDQLQFVAARLVCGDIMILSHIEVIWHALLACLLLAGSASQIQHSASASLLSNTSGDGSSVWCTLMRVPAYVPPHPQKPPLAKYAILSVFNACSYWESAICSHLHCFYLLSIIHVISTHKSLFSRFWAFPLFFFSC